MAMATNEFLTDEMDGWMLTKLSSLQKSKKAPNSPSSTPTVGFQPSSTTATMTSHFGKEACLVPGSWFWFSDPCLFYVLLPSSSCLVILPRLSGTWAGAEKK